MTGFPTVRSRLRWWSVTVLVLGVLAGGTTLAVAGSSTKTSDEYGDMGASPVPVVGTVSGPTGFRVSSFNVLGWDHTAPGGSKYKKGYRDGRLRMKWAVKLIRERQIDVIGLQELQPLQYDRWVKNASVDYDIYPGYTGTVGYLRNSIAWRRDKFRLVSSTWLKLPYFHGDVLRMPVVLLQSLQTGQQMYFMNFQNPADVRGNAEKWRRIGQRHQIALVNLLKVSNGLPIIWTGDFNARTQAFCRVTKQAGMVSASGGLRTTASCVPPTRMVVDWIFGTGVSFFSYVQDRSAKVARVSDHHLIYTDVSVAPVEPIIPPPPPTPTPTSTSSPTSSPTASPTLSTS